MSVKSIFEFSFPAEAAQDGMRVAEAIGNDMPPLDGYLDHEVIQDVTDAGHVQVVTRWSSRKKADAVLAAYVRDPKVARAVALNGQSPRSFVGAVL